MRWLAVAAIAVGCGDDDLPIVDAAVDAMSAPTIAAPAPPAEPALPQLGPCPDGWIERITEGGASYCDPFPDGIVDCAGATYQRPGDRGCVPIGDPCPTGDYAEDLPSDAIYVKPDAPAGDGSWSRPFATLTAALAAAPDGATIALAKGMHPGAITIERDVTIVGACVAETTIFTNGTRAITAEGDLTLALRDLRIAAEGAAGIVGIGDVMVDLESIYVGPVKRFGVQTAGSMRARRVLVREEQQEASGIGIGHNGDLEDVVIVVDGGPGITSGERLSARRVVVRPYDGTVASGISIHGTLNGSELAMQAATSLGTQGSARSHVERSWLRADAVSEQTMRAALTADSIDVERTFMEGGVNAAVDVRLVDVVGLGTPAPSPDDTWIVHPDATLRLERVRLERPRGLRALGATLILRDVSIVGANPVEADVAIQTVVIGATLDAERVSQRGGRYGGFLFSAAAVSLTDVSISYIDPDVRPQIGVAAIDASRVVLDRVRITDAHVAAGIAAIGPGTRIEGSDVAIEEVHGVPGVTSFARGIDVEDGAELSLERVSVAGTRGHGVIAMRDGVVALRELSIDRSEPCAADCGGHAFGVGVGAYDARLSAERFAVRRASLCGAHLAMTGEIDLAHGTIADSSVAVCVGDDGYDLDRLSDDVAIEGNGRNLDSVALPVPRPLPPIEVDDL